MKLSLNQLVSPFIVLLIAVFTLGGCAKKPEVPLTEISMRAPLTPVQQARLLAAIENSGVQVIQQGSRLQLILPVNRFFSPQTTQIREKRVTTLRLIALYLHHYSRTHTVNYPIKIYAYTGTVPTRKQRRSLSEQFAQVIAAFMWSHGFSPQQMSVIGFGAKSPIASYRTPIGDAYNRRVMIQVN